MVASDDPAQIKRIKLNKGLLTSFFPNHFQSLPMSNRTDERSGGSQFGQVQSKQNVLRVIIVVAIRFSLKPLPYYITHNLKVDNAINRKENFSIKS